MHWYAKDTHDCDDHAASLQGPPTVSCYTHMNDATSCIRRVYYKQPYSEVRVLSNMLTCYTFW